MHRNSLWVVMKQYGIRQKIINIVKALYDGSVDEEATSEWYKITTGVKQGYKMSGFLFLVIVDCISLIV